MKTCTIFGDLSSEKASEQYPMVQVCDQCFKKHSNKEDAQIVHENPYDSSLGDTCHFCDDDV